MRNPLSSILILLSVFMFFSCENDTAGFENDNLDGSAISDDDITKSECFEYLGGNYVSDLAGDNSCVYAGKQEFRLVHFVEPENHEMTMSDIQVCPMIIDKINSGVMDDFSTDYMPESPYRFSSSNQKYTDISGIPEGNKCFEVDRYTIRFNGYDRSFFKDSMIGKKILLHVYGNYSDGAVINYITYDDNLWISINETGSGGYKWDSAYQSKLNELTPTLTAIQISDKTCEEICIKENYGEKTITDYIFQPPVEIEVDGEEKVTLRNGESKVVDNYEYFADFSVTVSENDPDGKFTIGGDADPCPSENGQFYFSILNIGALK